VLQKQRQHQHLQQSNPTVEIKRPEPSSRRFFFDPRLAQIQSEDTSNNDARIEVNHWPAQEFRRAFATAHLRVWQPDQTSDRVRFSNRPITAAAVLVPIVMHPEGFTVLLTERSAELNDHAGQVAFPGGRFDDEDQTLENTALREAEEEIGLSRNAVELIGRLPNYQTGSGFIVTPVVALVQPNQALTLQISEVADAFEVPLQFLLDPKNHQRRGYTMDQEQRSFFAMPWIAPHERPRATTGKEYFVWGATAGMLRNLYQFLAASQSTEETR
jgi:8-oxo-dGTP pyrophosphatase MutT (NUDIX family)